MLNLTGGFFRHALFRSDGYEKRSQNFIFMSQLLRPPAAGRRERYAVRFVHGNQAFAAQEFYRARYAGLYIAEFFRDFDGLHRAFPASETLYYFQVHLARFV